MRFFKFMAVMALVLGLSTAGYAETMSDKNTAQETSQNEMTCKVISVNAAANQVTLDHEGRQHTLTVTNTEMLDQLKNGDSVRVVKDTNDPTKATVYKK